MADLEAAKPFQGLNPDELQNLRQIAQKQPFIASQQIFREGSPGIALEIADQPFHLQENHRRPGGMYWSTQRAGAWHDFFLCVAHS